MINNILWATKGLEDQNETQSYVELLASKYKAKVFVLNIVPDYQNFVETFPEDEKNGFIKWVENNLIPKEKTLFGDIAKKFEEKGIQYEMNIVKGIPSREILNSANKLNIDLIILGKGRAAQKTLLGGTALKVLRKSTIPVLTINKMKRGAKMRDILVPDDLKDGLFTNLKYAIDFSKPFGSKVHHLNIVEVGEHDFPPDIVTKIKGNSYFQMEEKLGEASFDTNIDSNVEIDKNAWMGIVKYAREKYSDLIIMTTHGGDKSRDEFLGSTAEKVIQEAPCPVLAMKP